MINKMKFQKLLDNNNEYNKKKFITRKKFNGTNELPKKIVYSVIRYPYESLRQLNCNYYIVLSHSVVKYLKFPKINVNGRASIKYEFRTYL